MSSQFLIEFHSTDLILSYGDNEDKEDFSKLLDPASQLYGMAYLYRKQLLDVYPELITQPQRMPFHLELVPYEKDAKPDTDLLLKRAKLLQGQMMNCGWEHLVKYKNAIVLMGPPAEDYGPTHLTIAHFKDGVPYSFPWLRNDPGFKITAHNKQYLMVRYNDQPYRIAVNPKHTTEKMLEILRNAEAVRKAITDVKEEPVAAADIEAMVDDIVKKKVLDRLDDIRSRLETNLIADVIPNILEQLHEIGILHLTPVATDLFIPSLRKRKTPAE